VSFLKSQLIDFVVSPLLQNRGLASQERSHKIKLTCASAHQRVFVDGRDLFKRI
jgi:hypothetical protein